jgi:hypothetical protein
MTIMEDRVVQVRHVPPDVHVVLRRRAAEEGKSMQEYLLELLIAQARRPTLREALDRAGGRAGGRVSLRDAAEQLRAERDSR